VIPAWAASRHGSNQRNTQNEKSLTIKALSISGVTWRWHFLNHARLAAKPLENRMGQAGAQRSACGVRQCGHAIVRIVEARASTVELDPDR